jgi:chaperonin GroES
VKTTLEPLGDRILAKRIEAETVRESGLIIPEVARERPQEALVVAVGAGKVLDHYLTPEDPEKPTVNLIYATPRVKPGDRILVGKYVGNEVSIDNELFLILREEEILGVLREEEVPA